MKLQVKLNKEEAQAFKNFMEMVKPPEVPEDDFLKGIFKIGIETMEEKLMLALKEHAEKNDIDLDQAVKDVDAEAEAEAETLEESDEVQAD